MPEYTSNGMTVMMHKNTVYSLNLIADHAKKYDYEKEEIVRLILDMADELSAQVKTIEMIDELNNITRKDNQK